MPTGIAEEGLKTLAAQGTGWLLFVLTLCALAYAVKYIRDTIDKRFQEYRELLDALNRSSDALATMKISVDARTEAINQLVGGFANLVRDKERSEQSWTGIANDFRARLEDIQRRVP